MSHKGKNIQTELSAIMIGSMEGATEGIDPVELSTCKKVLHQVFLNLADEDMLFRFSKNSSKGNNPK